MTKSDIELVKLSAQKDREAYRILVERYQTRAFSIAYSVLHNRQDAEDVVQESFVKAYLSLPKFKGDSTFYTWFYRIVRNMAIDVKRKIKRESRFEQDNADGKSSLYVEAEQARQASNTTPDSEYVRKEQSRRIGAVLQEISEEHRTVIVLREIEGMNYDQIAEVTGVSKGTIMSRLHYARKKLQQALKDLYEGQQNLQNSTEIEDLTEEIHASESKKSNKILRGTV